MIGLEVQTGEVEAMLAGAEAALAQGVTADDMQEAVDLLMHRILTRTREGRSVRGSYFRRYKPATMEQRTKRGRNTSPVTLTDSGQMSAALTGRVDGTTGVLYFATRRSGQIALWLHEGTRRMVARPWFGVAGPDEREMAALLANRLAARVERGGR
ncbi:MAG: hypothetical protein AAGI01_05465 [Myxococcota bacterium]